ncbi:MAG: leucyl/phenylalanyl-tRNA--protein transferase [Cypionkella sp.]|nr:leucyl/phenylalanyl-tRNA--protein transferase [Cypionkella sp.]
MSQDITPELLLHAYSVGVFPMASSRESREVHWMQPRLRGVFELDRFHISRSLRKRLLQGGYEVSVNRDFAGVVRACADRPSTWINAQIYDLYEQLHARGAAHSLEVWCRDTLIGGVYGVALGGAFFGESMFSRRTNASKIALAYLVHRLRAGGFVLFDTQYITPHLASLGAVEIPRADYEARLARALPLAADFTPKGYCPLPSSVVSPSSG